MTHSADLAEGVALSLIPDGAMLLGHAYCEPVLLARRGDALFAIGAVCTHYGAPLADGLLVDETVRCPLASRLFQPADRRGASPAGVGPGVVLARQGAGLEAGRRDRRELHRTRGGRVALRAERGRGRDRPDPLTGERIRVEQWVVAERQGHIAARKILGRRERFDAVPFFWTEQYEFSLAYVGHAERFDSAEMDGELDTTTQDCTITYRRSGKRSAVALVHRDLDGLRAEVEFEKTMRGEPACRTEHSRSKIAVPP